MPNDQDSTHRVTIVIDIAAGTDRGAAIAAWVQLHANGTGPVCQVQRWLPNGGLVKTPTIVDLDTEGDPQYLELSMEDRPRSRVSNNE